jgi:hypothetical protein
MNNAHYPQITGHGCSASRASASSGTLAVHVGVIGAAYKRAKTQPPAVQVSPCGAAPISQVIAEAADLDFPKKQQ